MREEEGFVIGSGNVFADLGLEDPEELLLKAQLVQLISHIIRDNRWTQKQAAAVLGVDQPKVSALVRGKLSGFSVDRLLRFVGALGYDFQLTLTPKRSPRPQVVMDGNAPLTALDHDETITVSPKPVARLQSCTTVTEPVAAGAGSAERREGS